MKKRATFYVSAALLLALAALLLCLTGPHAAVWVPGGTPDPVPAAEELLSALRRGDYAGLSELCTQPLPAETELTGDAAVLYALLKESWDGGVEGSATVTGRDAFVPMYITSLDPEAFGAGLKDDVNVLLSGYVEAADTTAGLYNDDGSYRDELVLRAWDEALSARSAHGEDYLRRTALILQLRYEYGAWHPVPDGTLLSALSGGL